MGRTDHDVRILWATQFVVDSLFKFSIIETMTDGIQPFRYDDDAPNTTPGAGLHLDLKDFASGIPGQNVTGSFLIEASKLYAFLGEAEARRRDLKQIIRRIPLIIPESKKRERSFNTRRSLRHDRLGEVQRRRTADTKEGEIY